VLCCFLPAIIGTLIVIPVICLIFGPLIILGFIGFTLIVNSFIPRAEKKPVKQFVFAHQKPKPFMVQWGHNDVPLKVLIGSIISSLIICPILIILFIIFCPAIIAIPLICITLGVEIGKLCRYKKR
jgi:hypothetical protein